MVLLRLRSKHPAAGLRDNSAFMTRRRLFFLFEYREKKI